jgi:hypothetical protein
MAEPKNPPVIPTSQSRPSSEPPDEVWEELETTIDLGPSDRQVALEQAVTFVTCSIRQPWLSDRRHDILVDRTTVMASVFYTWLTQDEERADDIEHPHQVGLGATDHGCDE